LAAQWKVRRRKRWRKLEQEIAEAAACVARNGYCVRLMAAAGRGAGDAARHRAAADPCAQCQPDDQGGRLGSVVRTLEQPLLTLAAQVQQAIGEIDL
jgi:hypothetical protein